MGWTACAVIPAPNFKYYVTEPTPSRSPRNRKVTSIKPAHPISLNKGPLVAHVPHTISPRLLETRCKPTFAIASRSHSGDALRDFHRINRERLRLLAIFSHSFLLGLEPTSMKLREYNLDTPHSMLRSLLPTISRLVVESRLQGWTDITALSFVAIAAKWQVAFMLPSSCI